MFVLSVLSFSLFLSLIPSPFALSVVQVEDAIKYYTIAESFGSAIRLAKGHGLRAEMLSLALRASRSDMIEAAEYCESQPGLMDKVRACVCEVYV